MLFSTEFQGISRKAVVWTGFLMTSHQFKWSATTLVYWYTGIYWHTEAKILPLGCTLIERGQPRWAKSVMWESGSAHRAGAMVHAPPVLLALSSSQDTFPSHNVAVILTFIYLYYFSDELCSCSQFVYRGRPVSEAGRLTFDFSCGSSATAAPAVRINLFLQISDFFSEEWNCGAYFLTDTFLAFCLASLISCLLANPTTGRGSRRGGAEDTAWRFTSAVCIIIGQSDENPWAGGC